MSAQAGSEEGSPPIDHHQHHLHTHEHAASRDPRATPEAHPHLNGESADDDANNTIKVEDASGEVQNGDSEHETATTLRPDTQPSIKRRESEAGDTASLNDPANKSKKRKRAVSPPWQFGTVEQSTVKLADGRRVSARFNASNAGTPVVSESEGGGRARSVSQSQSQSANRSRGPSPPWKKFQAEGPTSIQIDGVRKSGRVNKELGQPSQPKRVSPRQKKQVEKLQEEVKESKSAARPASRGKLAQVDGAADSPAPKKVGRPPKRSPSPSTKIADLKAQIAALQPTRSFPSPNEEATPAANGTSTHKRKRSDDVLSQSRTRRPSSPTTSRKPGRPSQTPLPPSTAARPSPGFKLKLNFGKSRKPVPPPHPLACVSPPAKPPKLSLYQVIEPFELQELQQPYMENERGPPGAEFFRSKADRVAVEEGQMRKRLLEAAQPGKALSQEECSVYQDEQQPEPPKQYGHTDHLVAHVLYLRSLQKKEENDHKNKAKKLAHEALEYWKLMRGPTEEDLVAEQERINRLIYKQTVVDIRAKWEMVQSHVQALRRERWEAEEDARRQERLEKQLEQAQAMVAKQRGENSEEEEEEEEEEDVDMENDSEVGEDDEMSGENDDADEGEGEEENMTESESEDEDEGKVEEGGEMTKEELEAYIKAQKEAEPPDKSGDAEDEDEQEGAGLPDLSALVTQDDEDDAEDEQDYEPNQDFDEEVADAVEPSSDVRRRSRQQAVEIDEANEDLNLSEDESEEMYDSDEDMSSSEDGSAADEQPASGSDEEADESEEAEDEAGDVGSSMLNMLYKSKKKVRKLMGLPTPTTSAEGDARDRTAEPVSDGDARAEDGAVEAQVQAEGVEDIAMDGVEKGDGDIEVDEEVVRTDEAVSATEARSPSVEANTKQLAPVPSLLRGTLRSYQHAGLDWLASLHRAGTNGILADEMGLGKTIQTIALLAHLAEHKQIWEPHLIIVPTSVILNWVTEFQKFLPGFRVLGYYGTAEERLSKRKGWVNDPHHEDKTKRGYNVVVTSYNVAIQDINAIRNVQWHYLVLDEAHNIRNFHSQRWQMLIRLKTRARLLLTGTPLQNSLTELWSLLTFLTAGDDDPAHGDLEEFLSHWKEPVKEIFDRGVSTLSTEAQKVVDQLHVSLRPFLLRRLKSEVEKDLPKKTESVVVCKLSKRQRQLYQEYMGLASTRASLTKGNAVSAGRVLLSLRRVCNHPDLFDPRPIQTSYALEVSPVEPYSVKERLVRELLRNPRKDAAAVPSSLMLVGREDRRSGAVRRSKQLSATGRLQQEVTTLQRSATQTPDLSMPAGSLAFQRLKQREKKLQHLRECIQISQASFVTSPIYGEDLRQLLSVRNSGKPYTISRRGPMRGETIKTLRGWSTLGSRPLGLTHKADWLMVQDTSLQRDVKTLESMGRELKDTIVRFAFCTPVATAPVLDLAIPGHSQQLLRATDAYPDSTDIANSADFAHEARIRTSIVFPDSRLLVYDSGKLQRLTLLLRELQAKGSRSLIFTQMTGTLNILEQFLSLLGLPYLRLDGSTPPEKRMIYSSEFNRPDSKYQCMILSSRAGGVGLNLTGASSVIFYDLDWNPQMDRQCMDRAHRIGQVRDVEVFKMVSEKTVEENILRRANQKSLLDRAVIQEGHFTTEYKDPVAEKAAGDNGEGEDDVSAAIERFLGGGEKATTHAIASVEDREDVAAAEAARKEENQDAEEFTDRSSKGPSAAATPGPATTLDDEDGGDPDRKGHVDAWMVKYMEEMMKDVPFVPPAVRKLGKDGRDPSHRPTKGKKRVR